MPSPPHAQSRGAHVSATVERLSLAKGRHWLTDLPRWTWPLVAVILLGAVLRLVWVGDMEYKGDETYLFDRSQSVGHGASWPWVGQDSGAGPRNPGMGIWVFVALARVFALHDPTSLARGVMVLNVLALAGLVAWIVHAARLQEREMWLWGSALLALSAPAILFSRKIWVQSALPPFVLLVLVGWWRRDRRWGAFLWGLMGAWLGQIHMSGFFFAAALAAWTGLFARRGVRWRAWLAGSVLGALTLIPWADYVLTHPRGVHASLANFVTGRFWSEWVAQGTGFDLRSSFGSDLQRFLAFPSVAGTPSHGVVATAGLIAVVGLLIGARAVVALGRHRGDWHNLLTGRRSDTTLIIQAAFVAFGLFLTAPGTYIYRHYLIVAWVLPFLWIAWLALLWPRWGRRLLAILCVAQALLSVEYLTYIHANHGAPRGDYGVSYDAQSPRH